MILGVIPARWASTRFPGKPLAEIAGRPMIWHVYQRCQEAGCLDRTLVATDDDRLLDACEQYHIDAMMTASTHPTGTDRVAEVARSVKADLYVNVQGDEPLISPEAIRLMAEAGKSVPYVANGCAETTDLADLIDATVPKVLVGKHRQAIYLSRSPVPYPKTRGARYLIQVCVYAFTPEGLRVFANTPQGQLERSEGIELLRFIERHLPVKMIEVPRSPVAVDTLEDLERARQILIGPR